MAIVLHHSRATGTAKLLLLGIANHDGDGGSWPSLMRLATYAGVDIRNVRRALPKLVELGEVEVIANGGGMVNTPEHARTHLYRLLVKCPPNCDGTTQHRRLCLECDEPLPFARYAFDRHAKCMPEPVDNYPGAPASPPGASALSPGAPPPPEPSSTSPNIDISESPEVDVRARGVENFDECDKDENGEHHFAQHNGKPWRCTRCGIHHDELEGDR